MLGELSPTTSRQVGIGVATLILGVLAIPCFADVQQEDATPTATLGTGEHTYRWVEDWGRLPEGAGLGNTHGCIVVDGRGRIYVNTDTERAVLRFAADGSFLDAWGKEWAGGLHGMWLHEEDGQEFLYMTHIGRHEVVKADLDGNVLWTLGYPEASGLYENANEYRPTSVAVAPDGSFFVADGYGKSWIHRYDAERRWLGAFGGPGTEPGQLKTPHGIHLDARGAKPRLIVADRENHRLQLFELDGTLIRVVTGDLRRPCHVNRHGDDWVVADLAGRVTILDADFELVTHLGDQPDPAKRANNGVPVEDWRDGVFFAPHCAAWDAHGDLYVMDWLAAGRVSKLVRTGK